MRGKTISRYCPLKGKRVGAKDRLQTLEKLQQSRSLKPVALHEEIVPPEEGDDADDVTSRQGKIILL
jgi:hypothetical protein